jgi:hypothetical protein
MRPKAHIPNSLYIYLKRRMDELFIDLIQLHSLNIFIHQLQANNNNNMPCVIFLKTIILL